MHRSFRAAGLALLLPLTLAAQTRGVTHGQKSPRGPVDLVVENGVITDIVTLDPVALRRGDGRRPAGDVQIDATGKFVLPGLINAHTHMQSNRSGQSMGGFEYYMLLQLANGITTVREVGAESDTGSIRLRDRQAKGEFAGPR